MKEFINSKSLSSVEKVCGVIITHFSCTKFCTYLHLYLMEEKAELKKSEGINFPATEIIALIVYRFHRSFEI